MGAYSKRGGALLFVILLMTTFSHVIFGLKHEHREESVSSSGDKQQSELVSIFSPKETLNSFKSVDSKTGGLEVGIKHIYRASSSRSNTQGVVGRRRVDCTSIITTPIPPLATMISLETIGVSVLLNMLKQSASRELLFGCGSIKPTRREHLVRNSFFTLAGLQECLVPEFPLTLNVVYYCETTVEDVKPKVSLHHFGVWVSTVIAQVVKVVKDFENQLLVFSMDSECDFQITYPYNFMVCLTMWMYMKVKSVNKILVRSLRWGSLLKLIGNVSWWQLHSKRFAAISLIIYRCTVLYKE
jgi:hypothetical protein